MLQFWKQWWSRLWQSDAMEEPQHSGDLSRSSADAAGAQRRPSGFPTTYLARSGIESADIFDPALKQFGWAFRPGEPVFQDEALARRWYAARRAVIDHILRTISDSEFRDLLVLRGSVWLKGWLGEAAREPGDVDWVVNPSSITLADAAGLRLLNGLTNLCRLHPQVQSPEGLVTLLGDELKIDDIWTYDRAPGKRVVVPWRVAGIPSPSGFLQMDLVFGEELWCPPVLMQIATAAGKYVTLWAASKQQSLAWKIRWLESDCYPQGKDLYDATLLAEQTRLPLALLRRALTEGETPRAHAPLTAQFPLGWDVDWDNFRREYPWVQGDAQAWQERLAKAIAPSFSYDSSDEGP
jgi:hypothetical protein